MKVEYPLSFLIVSILTSGPIPLSNNFRNFVMIYHSAICRMKTSLETSRIISGLFTSNRTRKSKFVKYKRGRFFLPKFLSKAHIPM